MTSYDLFDIIDNMKKDILQRIERFLSATGWTKRQLSKAVGAHPLYFSTFIHHGKGRGTLYEKLDMFLAEYEAENPPVNPSSLRAAIKKDSDLSNPISLDEEFYRIFTYGYEVGYAAATNIMRCLLENLREQPGKETAEEIVALAVTFLEETREKQDRPGEPVPIKFRAKPSSNLVN